MNFDSWYICQRQSSETGERECVWQSTNQLMLDDKVQHDLQILSSNIEERLMKNEYLTLDYDFIICETNVNKKSIK